MVRRSILDRICRELLSIRCHLDDIEKMFSNWHPQPLHVSESILFSLPDHLRKTYLVVASRGECSATQVSNVTGRSRANESSYLNQLARMGWLTKRRDSKTLHFRPVSDRLLRKQLRQAISENGLLKCATIRTEVDH
jgi:predicted transcriptional regulator